MSEIGGLTSVLNSMTKAAERRGSAGEQYSNREVCDSEAFDKVVRSRRSVRVFDQLPVDESIMQELFDLAMLAPSSSNLQPWEFHWVRSPDKKKQLVEACLSQPAAKTAGELVVIVVRTGTWRRNIAEMVRRLQNMEGGAPAALLFYYQRLVPAALLVGPMSVFAPIKWFVTRVLRYFKPTPQEPLGYGDLRVWAHKSVALAAQTLMLAARSKGLDTCPMEGFDSWRVRRILKLPCDAEISMVVGIGKGLPAGVYGPRLRFDRSNFVFRH